MKKKIFILIGLALILSFGYISALIVDVDYITIYHGEEGRVNFNIDNNEDFDIKDVSVALGLNNLPFTSVGSSEKSIEDIDEGDEEDVSFTLRAATDITPGDYDISYTIKYTDADSNDEEKYNKTGSFGIRVSARTDIDFSAEAKGTDAESAIAGEQGQISIEIINKGIGEIKSASVEIEAVGFELISSNKIFVGSISGDDTDIATFDVIFQIKNPSLKAKVTYKDFDNNNQEQTVNMPLKVYTREEALEKCLIKNGNAMTYGIVIVVLLILWLVWRSWRKRRKNKKKVE